MYSKLLDNNASTLCGLMLFFAADLYPATMKEIWIFFAILSVLYDFIEYGFAQTFKIGKSEKFNNTLNTTGYIKHVHLRTDLNLVAHHTSMT